jgi:hypothetical protein
MSLQRMQADAKLKFARCCCTFSNADGIVWAVDFRFETLSGWVHGELARCRKILSESFDMPQDERRIPDFIDDLPFMLGYSKHSEPFFSNLLLLLCQ